MNNRDLWNEQNFNYMRDSKLRAHDFEDKTPMGWRITGAVGFVCVILVILFI